MAQILYPPYIEGKLPAQCGTKLRIPFQFNRATGAGDVAGSKLLARIKGVNTNSSIAELNTDEYDDNIAVFSLLKTELTIGQYYKIQVAWEGSSYYSAVGVFKYTSEGLLSYKTVIKQQNILQFSCSYITLDPTEKVYKYQYSIKDINYNIIYLSPEFINAQEFQLKEEDGQSFFALPLNLDLSMLDRNMQKNFYIDIVIDTLNHLNQTSFLVEVSMESIPLDNQPEQLYIDKNEAMNEIYTQDTAGGVLRRRKKGEQLWQVLTTDFNDFNDITVEDGVTYEYELYSSDRQLYAKKEISPLYFDDMYLSDKDKNYCIQFNPKVSSFKTNILEQRQNTLGGKYPVFIRNGQTDYVEFGISGLISYLMNRPEETESQRTETSSMHKDSVQSATNLIGENIYKERVFRTELIKWLNNGQPKLFRSPTEGNFIVRITNVSLTPNDTLGRMLYTFNCTAVEVAECNYENLRKYNLVK